MTKITRFIALCFLMNCLIVISCSKKSDSDPTPTVGCLMTKSTLTFSGGGSQVSVYNYDTKGTLTGYTLTITNPGAATVVKVYTYAYTGGVLSSVTEAIQGGTTTVATWTTDANHRVAKITTNGTPVSESNCTYDGDGNMSTMVIKSGPATTNLGAHFASAQLQSMNSDVSTTGLTINTVFSYAGFDLKNNPWSLLATATGQKFFTNSIDGNVNPEFLFKSNPGTDEFTSTGTGGSNHSTNTYTYEYNSKNYPTKITKQQAGGYPVVTTFEYSNCN